jgi:hypothetical protein
MKGSPVTTELIQMARAACGKHSVPERTGGMFGLFDRKSRVQLAGT